VLHLVKANSNTLDIGKMDEALMDLGFVIKDDLDDLIQDVLAGNESGLNRESLWRRIVEEIVGLVQSYSGNPYGKNAVKIVESFRYFPPEVLDYTLSRIVNPLIEEVKDAIKVSEGLLGNDDLEALKTKNYLNKVEWIIKDLEKLLGDDNVRFQAIANAYADEVNSCAVKAFNHFKNQKLSMMLIQWANSLPSFSRVKSQIEKNLGIISTKSINPSNGQGCFGILLRMLKGFLKILLLGLALVVFKVFLLKLIG
jgi:hypothetical protein